MTAMKSARTNRAFTVFILAALLLAPALAIADAQEAGHYDNLGEDGLIWVPDTPVKGAYLPPADLGPYHNASETVAALQALAAARPDLFTIDQIGTSVQGRPILRAIVSGPGDRSARALVLIDAAHHGNEVIGAEIATRFLQSIAAQYDTNATLRAILDGVVLHVIPMVNVDGNARVPTCNHYADCRKNSRGVDLNRNYPAMWGGGGSSSDPGSATYRGPFALSEPESAAVATIINSHDFALHATLHSGAELILWPPGHTTTAGIEQALFTQLGNELTARTGVTNGQSSRILYVASGTTMDQSYLGASGWRPMSFTPETFEGSGSASDWWYLFNPTDAAMPGVVARWQPFLWHLAAEAPNFRPATLTVPLELDVGPDTTSLPFSVDIASRRPLMGADLRFAADINMVRVDSTNPVPLANATGTQAGTFTLAALAGGVTPASLTLNAGPAGVIRSALPLRVAQVALTANVALPTMGSPENNAATATLTPGPFDRVEGTLTLRLGTGEILATETFDVATGNAHSTSAPFSGASLPRGTNTVEAIATFTAHLGTDARPGTARATATFAVERPQVDLDKRFPATGAPGTPVLITAVYKNVGGMSAKNVEVRETVPPGYTYYVRDGPIPVPLDPLGKPMPDAIELREDGGLDLVYRFGTFAPSQQKFAQYRLMPIAPGAHALGSAWTYTGDFATTSVDYSANAAPAHTVSP